MDNKAITNIFETSDVTLITFNNIPNRMDKIAKLFTTIGNENVSIDMITQSAPYKDLVSLSFSIANDDFPKILELIKAIKNTIPSLNTEINSGNCKITLYGELMKQTPGVAAKVFELLAQNDITIKLITTSEVDISLLIGDNDIEQAISCLKQYYKL